MRKTLLISGISYFLLVPCIIYSQVQQDWVRKFVGTNLDNAAAITVDNSGNVWICGNNNWGLNDADMYTVRYNSSGLQTAGFLYDGPSHSHERAAAIATDPAGNIYVAGQTNVNSATSDIVVIKYNSSAIQQWVTIFNTPQNYNDDVVAMAVDAAGNIYLGGSVVKEEPFSYDFLTVKINTAGVVQWNALYNGTADGVDMIHDIAVDPSGNVYVTGLSQGQVKKKGFPISTGYDFVTIKYSSNGSQLWIGRYRKSNLNDEPNAMALDAAGNIYVSGFSSTSPDNSDVLTIKYRNNGNVEWVQTFAGAAGKHDFANDIISDASGNIYITGATSNASGRDNFIIKYNSGGVQQWISTYNVGEGTFNEGKKIGMDIFGAIYIAAVTNVPGIVNSDFLTLKYSSSGVLVWDARYNGPEDGTDIPTSLVVVQPNPNSPIFENAFVYVYGSSANDVITIKYSQPIVIGDPSELENNAGIYKISNTPNPFHGTTNITYELPEEGNVILNVFDVAGRKIATLVDGVRPAGVHVERFDAGSLARGVYHYQYIVHSGGKEFRQTRSMILR